MDQSELKVILERVRSQLPDEVMSKVSSDLKAIESGFMEVSDSARVASSEAKDRKLKLRDLQGQIENIEIERDEWKTKFESYDDTELKKERDIYKAKYQNFINNQKTAFLDFFEKASSTDQWGKVKDEYKIPEKDGDEYKWDKLELDDFENNIAKMNYHNKLGLFEVQQQPPKANTGKVFFDGKPVPTIEEYNEIRAKHGPSSPQARDALNLIMKAKGV